MAAVKRTLFLDDAVGETRGVVLLGGRPERLLIERPSDGLAQTGARFVARVARLEKGLASAFLELPGEANAVAPLFEGLIEGAAVEIEITASARRGKSPVATILNPAAGAPRLIQASPSIEAQLASLAPDAAIIIGPEARDAADAAQEAAIAVVHRLPGGGVIAIETTRALTAIDVDVADRGGGDARRTARQTNLAAITEAARLLRLKGIGGLVVFDLVGKGHDGTALLAAAKAAFAADGPSVSFGAISRFGLFEMALPRAGTPVGERLLDERGEVTAMTAAFGLMRDLERAGRSEPGARLVALCAPDVADCAETLTPALFARLGPRVVIEADRQRGRSSYDVRAL